MEIQTWAMSKRTKVKVHANTIAQHPVEDKCQCSVVRYHKLLSRICVTTREEFTHEVEIIVTNSTQNIYSCL